MVELVGRMPESEVAAVEQYLDFFCADRVSGAVALAPEDDEPESEFERGAVGLARGELERGERGAFLGKLKSDPGLPVAR